MLKRRMLQERTPAPSDNNLLLCLERVLRFLEEFIL
jgi:hypothetical protein